MGDQNLGSSNMSSSKRLLNHLDDPMRLLIFTIDEVVAFLAPFFLGYEVQQTLYGFCLGVGCYFVVKYMKKKEMGTNFRQLWYWYLPSKRKMFKYYVPSYFREFQG